MTTPETPQLNKIHHNHYTWFRYEARGCVADLPFYPNDYRCCDLYETPTLYTVYREDDGYPMAIKERGCRGTVTAAPGGSPTKTDP